MRMHSLPLGPIAEEAVMHIHPAVARVFRRGHLHVFHSQRALVALLVLPLLAGCGRQLPTRPVDTAAGTTGAVTSAAATSFAVTGEAVHIQGTTGSGALYSLDSPADWNGDLVLYMHGYTNPAFPVALPNNGAIRDRLLAAGYAVAASSYSSNGFAAAEGMRESHQLRGLFVSRVGPPRRTFLMGVSLGGLVGLMLAERYPQQYAGALLVSGIVGGTAAEVQYIGDAKVLFDVNYPNVHLGGLVTPIPVTNFNVQVAGPVVAAVQANPNGLGILNLMTRHPLPAANGQELVTSLLNVLGFQMQGALDLEDRTHGHMFFDNAGYHYTGPLPAAVIDGINAGVVRFESTRDAEAWLEHYSEPSGNLRIPVLTMHNERDPVVPFFHEALLRDAVHARGADAFLTQRHAATYGHVNFTPDEMVHSFVDLVSWVDTGVPPTP